MRRENRTSCDLTQGYPYPLEDETWVTRYQENRLVALIKDYQCVYVYWEISEERQRLLNEHFCCEIGNLPLFLRVYDVTALYFNGYNAHRYWEISIPWEADNWYIHGLEPGRNYFVDLGTKTIHGRFFTVLRSNLVELPPQPSGEGLDPSVRFACVKPSDGISSIAHDRLSHPPATASWLDLFNGYSLTTHMQKGES
ncbi:hypothetical protein DNHGIG_06240 [Collibacillus ludicampi]|jgi:hypothetical protein|uniref:DUF4912 domain-containing protein n=1 Tax=Collibacillus ludicampi TaxID=2771369 RepID=A0AAV4LBG7_9BACL|nr:DUF4912 domain-containing protein [Collibacillus ludicampi]GIM45075.1 hypothetical protein DNHGIG_06240 [Collibacillus ludicampi]